MTLKPVMKTPINSELSKLKREYKLLDKKFTDLKYRFMDSIQHSDFEVLNVDAFLELKEAYMLRKQLYWKIYRLENPDDTATEKAYRFLNSMHHNDQIDFLMEHKLTTTQLVYALQENPNFLDELEVTV